MPTPTVRLPPASPSSRLAAEIRLLTVMNPVAESIPLRSAQPGFDPAKTSAPPLTLLCSTFRSIAASWAESMLAMFDALAPSIQLFKAALFADKLPVKSRAVPLLLTRLSEVSAAKSDATSRAWPFLLDQNPSVNPPPAPRHALRKASQVALETAQVPSSVSVFVQLVGVVGMTPPGDISVAV